MSEADKEFGVSTLTGYRELARSQAKTIKDLGEQNCKLTLALLDAKPLPVILPGAEFPDAPWAKVDPLPQHPDHDESHLIIAATSLDSRLLS